jgi:septal ring factor EnvC (AmiA/AmiB activator)
LNKHITLYHAEEIKRSCDIKECKDIMKQKKTEIKKLNKILQENEKIIEDAMNEHETIKNQSRIKESNSEKLLQEIQEMEKELYSTTTEGQTKQELKCDQCGWITQNKNFLKGHMTSHKAAHKKMHSCGQKVGNGDLKCMVLFKTQHELHKHIKSTHNKKENTLFKCNKCKKSFTVHSSLLHHKKNKA